MSWCRDGYELERHNFQEVLDPVLQFIGASGWPSDDKSAVEAVIERAHHRARGAILLGRLDEFNNREFRVPEAPNYADRSDDYIRRLVLVALDDIQRVEPSKQGMEMFDDLGVCLFEDIDPRRMEYVLSRLEQDRLTEQWVPHSQPGNRSIRATAAGLRAADKLRELSLGSSLLMEETIASVERVVERYSQAITFRLREISKRVYEAKVLSHSDVGEIAQALDLVVQDFLDMPTLWDGIQGERPSRDQTRDRISLLLKAREGSETEQELVAALGDYLFGWLRSLDKFVNKHRHPTNIEQSSRLHAKRLLLYTYLLLADLIEVLPLS